MLLLSFLFTFIRLPHTLFLLCLHRRNYLQLLSNEFRRPRAKRNKSTLNPRSKTTFITYRILKIRMIVCSLVTSVSCCFSFFLSLMVPRFRWEYTLLARFFVDGAFRRLCCIIRTHSSMRASLTKNKVQMSDIYR
jgi:hypothetical protein